MPLLCRLGKGGPVDLVGPMIKRISTIELMSFIWK